MQASQHAVVELHANEETLPLLRVQQVPWVIFPQK